MFYTLTKQSNTNNNHTQKEWMNMWKTAMCDSLHDISSDVSPQSSSRSQLQARGIHRPFLHKNWSAWQGWAEGDERSHIIQSHMHKSMQDVLNNFNDHCSTSLGCQCPSSENFLSLTVTCCCLMGHQLHRTPRQACLDGTKWCLVGYSCQTHDEKTFISIWLMLTDWSSTDKRQRGGYRRQYNIPWVFPTYSCFL